MSAVMAEHEVVSSAKWIEARKVLLEKEKELSRQRDEVNRLRLELPWEKIEKEYAFEGPNGRETLADLFGGNSQLIVYHFMFGPEWKEGCPSCSFLADAIDGADIHLKNHDVTLLVVSRASLEKIEAFKNRMGWKFKWVSSYGSDFNFDYGVSFLRDDAKRGLEGIPGDRMEYNFETAPFWNDEMPGTSVFYKDEAGTVFHTYSAYARAGEAQIPAYAYLDIAPKGRNETGPFHDMRDWVKHHDRYTKGESHSCCGGH
jgi:predicted dithiol-disulfide oxidoreductase (DUF899 family)